MSKEIIKRTASVTTNLTKLASEFGYNIETDGQEDAWHNGYKTSDTRSQDLRLPGKYDDANKIFPSEVSIAMEDADRDAIADALREHRIEALKEALEKIEFHAEYQDMDGDMISVPVKVTDVEINKQEDTITITMSNPEHLINGIISGRGYFASDLPTTEAASAEDLQSRIHHIKDYFEVYGESKPSGEMSSQYSPSPSDEVMTSHLDFRIGEMTIDEVAQAVMEAVDLYEMEPQTAMDMVSKMTEFKSKDVKKKVIELAEKKVADDEEKIEFFKKNL